MRQHGGDLLGCEEVMAANGFDREKVTKERVSWLIEKRQERKTERRIKKQRFL